MSTTQEPTEHQFLVDLSNHLVKPGLYFVSIPNGWPCMYLIKYAKCTNICSGYVQISAPLLHQVFLKQTIKKCPFHISLFGWYKVEILWNLSGFWLKSSMVCSQFFPKEEHTFIFGQFFCSPTNSLSDFRRAFCLKDYFIKHYLDVNPEFYNFILFSEVLIQRLMKTYFVMNVIFYNK